METWSICSQGWPDRSSLPDIVKPYWKYQGDLSVHDNLLLFQNRIVIPREYQKEILQKLENGHQGIQRCSLRARSAVWWLHICHDIENTVQSANNPHPYRGNH